MSRAVIALLFVLGLFLPAVSQGGAAASDDWPAATPEEQGIDSAKLADALVTIHQEVPDLHSFLLVRGGELVVDAAFYPYDGTTPHDLASVTKSVMTTLIGIAVDQGALTLDDPVLGFFPDRAIANRDERKERMTVGQLASMTSGLACVWKPNEPTLQEMFTSNDWVQFTLDLPMAAEPGSRWEYCSPGIHLLSAILTKATGMTALDFAWQNLFGPLGIRSAIWPADPRGFTRGWGDLMLYPRDAAKLGQLWLNGGAWNGRQLVSEAWVAAAASYKATTSQENDDYGYGWWIKHENAVGGQIDARGRGGQYVEILPGLNTVIVLTGAGTYGTGEVTDLLVPALVDPTKAIPANPAGVTKLTDTIAGLTAAPAATPATLPEAATAISGKTYAFGANPAGFATLRLSFERPDEATIEIALAGGLPSLIGAIGLDGRYRFQPADLGFPMGLRGGWVDEQTFAFDYTTIANIDAYDVQLRFAGNTVTVALTERTWGAAVQFEGTAVDA